MKNIENEFGFQSIHEAAKRVNQSENAGNFIMPFGKYRGMSLDDIYCENPDYLEWIKDNFEDGWIQEKVKQYLWSPNGM